MDQIKIGTFLKQLRKEKKLTQEQLAGHFNVSSRTVSRWETGRNAPDVDMLIELADYYDVDIREIINGERQNGHAIPESKTALKKVAAYAAEKENSKQSKVVHVALGMCIALLICIRLFAGESKGLLYGIIPANICNSVLLFVYGVSAALLVSYLAAHWWQETPSKDSEKTVTATVASKEIKPGTHGAGRSKGGYSYVVNFLTEDGQPLELYAYEIEYGGLKEGSTGLLTYQGRYFVDFEAN